MARANLKLAPAVVERRGPNRYHIYAVRGVDALWHARRMGDGVTVAKHEEKGEALNRAARLGYSLGG